MFRVCVYVLTFFGCTMDARTGSLCLRLYTFRLYLYTFGVLLVALGCVRGLDVRASMCLCLGFGGGLMLFLLYVCAVRREYVSQ